MRARSEAHRPKKVRFSAYYQLGAPQLSHTQLKVKDLPPLHKWQKVPRPKLTAFRSVALRTRTRVRSEETRRKLAVESARKRARAFLKHAPKFRVPVDSDDLSSSIPIQPLQQHCDDVISGQEAQVFSAGWYDINNKPMLFYLADRIKEGSEVPEASLLTVCHTDIRELQEQYVGRRQRDLDAAIQQGKQIVCDGLGPDLVQRWHEVIQTVAAAMQPCTPLGDSRHQIAMGEDNPRVMRYRLRTDEGDEGTAANQRADEDQEDDGEVFDRVQVESPSAPPRLRRSARTASTIAAAGQTEVGARDQQESEPEVQERVGVYHFVHGWAQQAGKKKGLFLSSDMSKSGTAMAAVKKHYQLTRTVAECLGAMFEVLYPDVYVRYRAAFDAGVWHEDDPGPWLGRAIVYKLFVELHCDKNDEGPAASFPCGSFEGGAMLLPQLGAKLAYKPGHVCIFQACKIYHAVDRWKPTVMKPSDVLTPGRIGTVFFFPQNSLKELEGKPKGWAMETAYGRWLPDN